MKHLPFFYYMVCLGLCFFSLGIVIVSYLKRKDGGTGSLLVFMASCIVITFYLVLRFYFGAALELDNVVLTSALGFFEAYIVKLILLLLPAAYCTLYFFDLPKKRLQVAVSVSFVILLVLLDIMFERIVNDNEGIIEQFGERLVFSLSVAFLAYVLVSGIIGFLRRLRMRNLGLIYLFLLSTFTAFYVFRRFLGGDFSLNALPAFSLCLSAFAVLYMIKTEPRPALGKAVNFDEYLNRFGITGREADVIRQMLLGYSNDRIGTELFISANTVKTHVRNIFSKLGVASRMELAARLKIMRNDDPDHPE